MLRPNLSTPSSSLNSTTWISNIRQFITSANSELLSRLSRLRPSPSSSQNHSGDDGNDVNNDDDNVNSRKLSIVSTNSIDDEISIDKPKKEGSLCTSTDIESGPPKTPPSSPIIHRFEYDPRNFFQRILVSICIKNKLDSSRIIRVPFNSIYKYILIFVLLLLTFFLTPSLLPRWLGFEWAAPRDLCQSPDEKLVVLELLVRNESNADGAKLFLSRQKLLLKCMNESSDDYYHGIEGEPSRFKWPNECTSDIAQVSLTETHCQTQETNVCSAVGGFFGFLASLGGNCVKKVGPELCTDSTDKSRAEALLKLEQQRARMDALQESKNSTNSTTDGYKTETEPIISTANDKVQGLVSRIITQIDVAADAFILYSIIAIAVGVPLVIYRREKGSLVVSTAFGLTKASFVVVFVLVISIFDSTVLIFKETDFQRLVQNFMKDPCYVDPSFSAKRVQIIASVCNEIGLVNTESGILVQKMDSLFYDTRLFGYCKDDNRSLSPHPSLPEFDRLRIDYHNKTGIGLNPGYCNATRLNEITSIAPNDNDQARWQALLGSGVIAQLFLKFILTSWVMHAFAYVQPMVLHNGKVEIWGPNVDERLPLSEEYAVKRFARDKHLLALLIFSILVVIEAGMIIYAIFTTIAGNGSIQIPEGPPAMSSNETMNTTCPASMFA